LHLTPGETRLPVNDWQPGETLQLDSETWIPALEIGNQDTRRLAFQIAGIELTDRAPEAAIETSHEAGNYPSSPDPSRP
jgi:hypothetical protein